jgi:ATP-dependent RNA/DNA helicase IGHMBP2
MSAPDASPDVDSLVALWERERVAEVERFRAERDALPWRERLARGLALSGLDIDETRPAPGGRIVACVHSSRRDVPFDRQHVRLRPGDPVVLFRDHPDEPDAVRALVERWHGATLGLAIDPEALEYLEEQPFRLEREAPTVTFQRGLDALQRLRRPIGELGRMWAFVRGTIGVETIGRCIESWFDERLDGPQRDAIEHALRTGPIALIHGPPGTGKTRCLVEVVRQAVAAGQRVLVAAPSNAAVDNLVERLGDAGLDPLRLGHPARVDPRVEALTLDARLDATDAAELARAWLKEAQALKARTERQAARGTGDRDARRDAFREARRLMGDARHHLRRAEGVIVERARVVCATLVLAAHPALREANFDLVVVDEATQAVDPLLWIALGRAPHAILAGDPCQLPPTLIDPEVARSPLGRSLFERLHAVHGARLLRMLETQHRMHEAIMTLPSLAFYDGRLVAHPAVASHRIDDIEGVRPDPVRDSPIVFIDAAGAGWFDEKRMPDGSTLNREFARRTAIEVRRIVERGVTPQDIGVITPYDAQVGLLRAELADLAVAGLDISSIDGFQGREKEVIVLDLVRSNEDGDIGFLADLRRINVAWTRARRQLVLIGDSAVIGGHPFHTMLLQHVEGSGLWLSVFADDGHQ